MARQKQKRSFLHRHTVIRSLILITLVLLLSIGAWIGYNKFKVYKQQSSLAPFYDTSSFAQTGQPGELLRSEPLSTTIDGGTGYRILYRTQHADGSDTISSGLVFVPSKPANGPRPVVAWAHGTIGMGDACAPSRSANPPANIPGVTEMLQQGWVVTATDYSGLGTPGTLRYLIGGDEAHDVLNSVRAARAMPETSAGDDVVIWGHSQGGHSALFASSLANAYAPELNVKGTVASAPAAELTSLLTEQYGKAVDWVIGPEIVVAWPEEYPGLPVNSLLTSAAKKNYQRIAQKCIDTAAEEGLLRNALKQQFFKTNPIELTEWQAAATEQTAPVLTPSQPLLVVESTADQVVLPDTTAKYIARACQSGSNVQSLWLAEVGHIKLAPTSAPQVIDWLSDRFDGRPTSNTCYQPSPVTPASF